MKEITRVHIAKQPYDIEVEAKKELEKYMKKLELYAGDEEILADIEIRITELLAEAGVEKGGVITSAEVASVRERLGEPEEFASENQAVVEDEPAQRPAKRLFRDMDGALLGGVLKGVATFFGIDVVWVRLIFIILLFASFGTAFLVYIVLWLVVPPVRTTADRLQLSGKPVTLAALREQATADTTSPRAAEGLKSVLCVGGGILSILVAAGALIATLGVTGAFMLSGEMKAFMVGMSVHAWMAWVALGLFVLAGLLLSLLASLVAVMLLKRRATKRMGVAVVVIIVAGIVSASGGAAMMAGGFQLRANEAQASTRTFKEALPELAGVKKLEAQAYSGSGTAYNDADEMTIKYVVTTGAPRYELRTQFNGKPDVSVRGDTVRITLKSVGRQVFEYGYAQPELVIYGPALESINVMQGHLQYTGLEQEEQERLRVSSLGTTSVVVFGSYENLAVQGGGSVDASMSSVRNLEVDMQGGMTDVRGGVVYTLSVTYPDVCPIQSADNQRPRVSVRGVSSGEVTYNGETGPVVQRETPCGAVIIGKENIDEDE